MEDVSASDKEGFFQDVAKASATAIWCALATTTASGQPRVRLVHPTWEGDTLWIATDPKSPKSRQLEKNPWVDVQWQVAPPTFVHILARGRARDRL